MLSKVWFHLTEVQKCVNLNCRSGAALPLDAIFHISLEMFRISKKHPRWHVSWCQDGHRSLWLPWLLPVGKTGLGYSVPTCMASGPLWAIWGPQFWFWLFRNVLPFCFPNLLVILFHWRCTGLQTINLSSLVLLLTLGKMIHFFDRGLLKAFVLDTKVSVI